LFFVQDTYEIVAVDVAAQGAGAAVALVDAAGRAAWRQQVNSSGWAAPPSPVAASGVSVAGFESLCEVRLLVGSREPQPGGAGLLLRGAGGWAAGAGGAGAGDAAAVVDDDLRSCVELAAGAPLVVTLGAQYSIAAVQLVAGAPLLNVTVSVAPAGAADDPLASAVPCGAAVDLEAWEAAVVECGREVQGGAVVVSAAAAGPPQPLLLCDLALRGRRA
jgi:hypothetical protein